MIRSTRRKGLTLLEVVTAMAIFLVGVIALYQLLQNASYRAMRVDFRAQASLRCQSKLAEVVVGALPMESTDFQAFSDDDNYRYQIQVEEVFEGLCNVRVEVKRELLQGDFIRAELTQMVVPPMMRGSTLDASPTTDMSSTPKSSSTEPSTTEGGTGATGTTGTTGGTTGGAATTPAPAAPATSAPAKTGGGAPMGGGKR